MAELDDKVTACLRENGVLARNLLRHASLGTKLTPENVERLADKEKLRLARNEVRQKIDAEVWADNYTWFQANVKELGAKRALKAMLVRDLGDKSNRLSADYLAKGYAARANMVLEDVVETFKPTITGGQRNQDALEDMVLVMLGAEPKFEESQVRAKAMRQASDMMHKMYKAAGGEIGYIENWFPQNHNARALAKAKIEPWKAYIKPKLSRQNMVDDAGEALNDEQLDELLTYVYTTITTEGRNKAVLPEFNSIAFSAPTAAKNSMSRVLHFAEPKDALQYHKDFGKGDLWGNYTNSIRGLANDTAILKTFGANAEANFSKMARYVEQADSSFDIASVDAIWKNITGFGNFNENKYINALEATRDVASSAFMGSVLWASLPDVVTAALNMSMNDMNWGRLFSDFNSFGIEKNRKQLTRVAGEIEAFTSGMAANLRFEDPMGSGMARRLSDANYRLGGMNAWMDRLRHVWMNEMLTGLNDVKGQSFDQLSPKMQSLLNTYGLRDDWDIIRAADSDGDLLAVGTLADPDLSAKVLGAIYTERDLAILTPDARVRATMNQGLSPNSAVGQTLRAFGQFKTFAATMLMHGVIRYWTSNRLSTANKWQYALTSVAMMTTMGGVSYQIREMLKGREPMPMDSGEFWIRAAAQGGAMPILADLVLDGQTRHGRSGLEAFLGPTGGVAADLYRLSFGVGVEALKEEGQPAEYAGKALEKLSFYMPGSSLWWARLAVQRGLRDTILGGVDPTYQARMEQRERNLENRTGQGQFFEYDDDLGERFTPDW